jgi:hypothetical protein
MPDRDDYDSPRDRNRDDRDYDDRPRRRRRDDDDYDRPPKKSSAGLVIGIIVGVGVLGLLVIALLVGLMLPAVQRVRESAARMKDMNNLKQISLGVHNYESANGRLPAAEGDLSWRVHILPYIEQESLYRQFDTTQPWDGPRNKRFASQVIQQYSSVGDTADKGSSADTRYRVFVGPGTLYEPGKKPMQMRDIPDGAGNTIFAVEAADRVPWPQPKELQYSRDGALPALGSPGRKGFLAARVDGSVIFVSDKTSDAVIRGGIEAGDGRFFDP